MLRHVAEQLQNPDLAQVAIVCSFVKNTGADILLSLLESLNRSQLSIRLMTTTYMGISDAPDIHRLAEYGNFEVKIFHANENNNLSFHAKAWRFHHRKSRGVAIVGSSNLSESALYKGHEWNVLLLPSNDTGKCPLQQIDNEIQTFWDSSSFRTYNPNSETDRERLARELTWASGTRGTRGTAQAEAVNEQEGFLEIASQQDESDSHQPGNQQSAYQGILHHRQLATSDAAPTGNPITVSNPAVLFESQVPPLPDEGVEQFEPPTEAIKDRILAGSGIVESCLDIFLEREQTLGRAPSRDKVSAEMNSLYGYSGLAGLLGTSNRYMGPAGVGLDTVGRRCSTSGRGSQWSESHYKVGQVDPT